MASCHRDRAEQNGATPAEQSIGEEAAKDRSQINARGVSAKDRGGERLAFQATVEPTKSVERQDVLDASRQQGLLDHVEDEQRLHSIVGKALPRLGEGEIPEPARMSQEIGRVGFAGERRSVFGFSCCGHQGI